ncbi:MAG: ABC transporter substrate-binding protein [Verrucomicrobiaceae bacterium]
MNAGGGSRSAATFSDYPTRADEESQMIDSTRMNRRIFVLAACAAGTAAMVVPAHADTLDDIRAKGSITIGVGVMGTKPWVYKNEDGSYAGLEYEMMQYAIAKMGIPKFEYVPTEWDSLIPGLKAKRWDIIWSGMTVTEERRQGAGIDFSRPYYFESDRLAVKGDGPIQSPEDLKDKVIGAVTGTVEEAQARQLLAKGAVKDVKFFGDFATPFLALENGQIQAYVVDNTTYGEQKKVTPNLRTVGPVLFLAADPKWQDQQEKVPYVFGGDGIGVRKEDTTLLAALNDALNAMDADGTRQKILEKYELWDDSLLLKNMMKG